MTPQDAIFGIANSGCGGAAAPATLPASPTLPDPQVDRSAWVAAALEEYQRLCQAGRRPERAEFLARHAGVARRLGECLDALDLILSAGASLVNASAGQVQETPAAEDPTGPSVRLGDYRLIREVGRGGMGVVFEAYQVSLGRRVALKVLPATPALDPRQLRRFQLEAQAAALLNHPHIVPVFGVGYDSGVHYYAMQFIASRSLAEMIHDLRPRDKAGTGTRGPSGSAHRLDIRSTARLALQAAEALEHAHAMGVIHRDIKPSNLLVDERGHLWVTDFGLARIAREDAGLTRSGDLPGTLRYMSPEQIRGDRDAVGPRADVYALGVTLYELLTLRPFLEARDRAGLIHRILYMEPTAPRRIRPPIPRDLETIVLRAVAKEPSARYASAAALGEDLRRFLADEPILASPPGLPERVLRWGRRHRALVTTAASILVAAIAVGSLLLWQAKRETEAALASQRHSFAVAFASLSHSLDTIDRMIQELEDHPNDPSPSVRQRIDAATEYALGFTDQVVGRYGHDSPMQEIVAKAHRSAGRIRMKRGDARGHANYREAIRIYQSIAAVHPDYVWLRAALIDTLWEYSELLRVAGRTGESEPTFLAAVAAADELVGRPEADPACFRKQLVDPFNRLARGLIERGGDAAMAVRLAYQAVVWEPSRSALWETLSLAYARSGQLTAARTARAEATAIEDARRRGREYVPDPQPAAFRRSAAIQAQ